jgi:hypothetical protein
MKYLRFLPYLAIFLANLLIGYHGGLRILSASSGEAAFITNSDHVIENTPIPSLPNGQRSLLLITADQFVAQQSHLSGVWLLIYVPSDPRLTFLPIFPSPSVKDAGKELSDSFHLDHIAGHFVPNPIFLERIREHVPWWSGYIMMDNSAVAEVINLMVDYDSTSQSTDSDHFSQVVTESITWEDPYSALFGQASLYQEMCWGVAWMKANPELPQIQDRFVLKEGHFSTDLNPEQILAELQDLRGQGGSIVCEFPTLTVQARIVK